MKIIVVLGNPGPNYQATRHNAGFWWVEALAAAHRVALKPEPRFRGVSGLISLDDRAIRLLLPQTYMNASGESVGAMARYFKAPPEEILVIHDDLDLPPGAARLKLGGGSGGHNGLKDIVAHLGTAHFWRLRLGIGHPGGSRDVVDYVLDAPSREEAAKIDAAVRRSLEMWPLLARGQCQRAMLKLHSDPDNPPKPGSSESKVSSS